MRVKGKFIIKPYDIKNGSVTITNHGFLSTVPECNKLNIFFDMGGYSGRYATSGNFLITQGMSTALFQFDPCKLA